MRTLTFLLALLAFVPAPTHADDWDVARQPGVIAIMRHALAPGTSDPARFTLGDCSTQRNLDDRGRAQARATGAAFRMRNIAFDRVFTSQWCRTRETAALMELGPVTDVPALNSFFEDRSLRDPQTGRLRALLAETPGRLMLVTHQVNISALTGQSTRSGEVLLIRLVDGRVDVLGRILIAP